MYIANINVISYFTIIFIGTSPWTQVNVTDGNHRLTVLATCPDGGKKIKRTFRFKAAAAVVN